MSDQTLAIILAVLLILLIVGVLPFRVGVLLLLLLVVALILGRA
jgi:hypothetical protein